MKRFIKTVGLIVAIPAIGLLLGLSAAQAQTFDNSSLSGSYGLNASGEIITSGLPFSIGTSVLATGLLEFDGEGGCFSNDQLNIGGTMIPDPASFRTTLGDGSCIYTVNPDGTGFLAATFGPSQQLPGTIEITFVLVNDGAQVNFVTNSAPGFSANGTLTKQVAD